MHLVDAPRHFMGGYAIVGGHLPLATGLAFAVKYQKRDRVVLCFFGRELCRAGRRTRHSILRPCGVYR